MTFEVLPYGRQFAIFDAAGEMVAGPFSQRAWAMTRRKKMLQEAGLLDLPPDTGLHRKCMCCPSTFTSEGPHNRLCPNCRHSVGGLDRQMVG